MAWSHANTMTNAGSEASAPPFGEIGFLNQGSMSSSARNTTQVTSGRNFMCLRTWAVALSADASFPPLTGLTSP